MQCWRMLGNAEARLYSHKVERNYNTNARTWDVFLPYDPIKISKQLWQDKLQDNGLLNHNICKVFSFSICEYGRGSANVCMEDGWGAGAACGGTA